jgi:hypothetical protein
MNSPNLPIFPDSISLKEGVRVTTNWRDYISVLDPNPQYIRAFNIPMEDIVELAQFTKCPSIRAYLSMEIAGDISSLKVVLVPVDVNNKDVLSVPGATGVDESSIFDFTSPCPQICDIDSPLFDGKLP